MMIELQMHFGRYSCEAGFYYSGDAEPALEWTRTEDGFGFEVWKFAFSFISWRSRQTESAV